ncbi:MAG: LysM peptidoglycan-binding domain-containing protein, partial [Parvularculaceae bacterium]|nr:LysM peptidoglycan-binding domain-containing protein [Parvularculaceae bacterium]
MTSVGRLLIAASIGALAACGSSRTPAPVVYGSAPPQPVYPAGYPAAAPNYAGAPGYAPRPQAPVYQPPSQPSPYAAQSGAPYAQAVYSPSASPVKLTPVAAEPLDQAPARPMQIAQTSYDQSGYGQGGYRQPTYQPDSATRPGSWTSVRPGETVYAISRRTGAAPEAIIAENNLYPPYFLQVGQQIRVPGAGAPATPTYPQQPPSYQPPSYQPPNLQPISDSPSARRVVRPGETLFSISRETRVPVQRLADVNRLYPPYALQIGQSLVIPNGRD